MENVKYSFSRLENFHNCKRGYYYTYILEDRGGDNIYSFLGTITHELVQSIIQGKETNEEALNKFLQSIDDAELLGLNWMSEKVKQNYIECITHYIENFAPLKNVNNIKIEDYFEVNIMGTILRGYIDFWSEKEKAIYIEDFKTSSKFSSKDLIHKQRQLVLYGYALKQQYPGKQIIMNFDMLKYALRNGKLLERNKLDLFDEFDRGLVPIVYNEELENDLKTYVKETIDEINNIDVSNIYCWPKSYNPEKDFFCKNLCSFRERCLNIN